MSFDHLIVRDVEGERRVDGENLPLRIGTGGDCGLRLPGPGGAPVMLLDLLDGEPFVQPFGREPSVELNGEPLTTSKRLVDDDELRFFGSRIRIIAAEGSLILDVRLEDSAYVTQPPDSPGDAAYQEQEIIAPTAFQRVSETRGPVEKTHRHTLKIAVGAGLAELHSFTGSASGEYDPETGAIRAERSFEHWWLESVDGYRSRCLEIPGALDAQDVEYVDALIEDHRAALAVPFKPCFVHHDFKEGGDVFGPSRAGMGITPPAEVDESESTNRRERRGTSERPCSVS